MKFNIYHVQIKVGLGEWWINGIMTLVGCRNDDMTISNNQLDQLHRKYLISIKISSMKMPYLCTQNWLIFDVGVTILPIFWNSVMKMVIMEKKIIYCRLNIS